MAFPNSKTGKLEFDKVAGVNLSGKIVASTVYNALSNTGLDNLELKEESLSFMTNNSLFKIHYPVKFSFEVKENIVVNYSIALSELLKVSILVVIVAAFLSRLYITTFITFLLLLLAAFYIINILIIDSAVRRIINDLFAQLPFVSKEDFSKEQAEWLKDTSRCPACGSSLSEFDIKCPSCGISLPNRLNIKTFSPRQTKVSKSTPQDVNYLFTEKKKTEQKK